MVDILELRLDHQYYIAQFIMSTFSFIRVLEYIGCGYRFSILPQ
jgi:hypothetical protein